MILTTLLEPSQFGFMVNALVISTIVAVPCVLLPVFLVLKGWVLMGDVMSHVVFLGTVLMWTADIPLAIGVFIAGLFCVVATGYLDDNSRIKRDILMGIVFSGMFGAGLVLYASIRLEAHLDHILFGDMLGASFSDIIQTTVIMFGIALIIGLKWEDLLLHVFDPYQAKASGLNTALLHHDLLYMIALTIVATLKSVGITLLISLLTAPGAIAISMTQKFSHALWLAVIMPAVTLFMGVYLSFFIDSTPVPTIVVLFSLLFVMTLIYSTLCDRRLERRRQQYDLRRSGQ